MRENKIKLNQWKAEQAEQAKQQETIEKAKRRHNRASHAFAAWGKAMGMLKAIHRELEPTLSTLRSAEDFLHYGYGKQRKAARR
jgi:hypothetical protein